jgi:hypothetical protein
MTTAVVTPNIPADGAAATAAMKRGARRGSLGGGERTLLVIGHDPELAVALRDRLDRAYVTVREIRPAEARDAVAQCMPWPWMVVGDDVDVDTSIVDTLARYPVIVLWRGRRPPGLPLHTVAVERFSQLAGFVEAALAGEVAGVRLAAGGGVSLPDGSHAGSAVLEALLASHPRPMFTPMRHLRSASRTLASHGVPLRVARTGGGGVVLAAARDE